MLQFYCFENVVLLTPNRQLPARNETADGGDRREPQLPYIFAIVYALCRRSAAVRLS